MAGKVFHSQLAAEAGMEIRAAVTRNPERRQRFEADWPGGRIYDTYEQLLNDPQIDLVILGTPHDQHRNEAVAAAEAGKHCVTDKIMALSAKEAYDMCEAAQRNNVLLSVFHNRRWDSDYLTVQRVLNEGLIGEPYVIESSVVSFRETAPTGDLPWRYRADKGGGPLRDWGAHLVDQAVQLFGPKPSIEMVDLQYRWPAIDVETAAAVSLRYPNGVRYRIEVGSISALPRPRWHLRGSKGALELWGLDPQESHLKEGRVVGGTDAAKISTEKIRFDSKVPGAELVVLPGDYRNYYRNVAAAIRGEAELAVKAEQVRDVMVLYDELFAAAR